MNNHRKIWITVLVAALGYFVDIYDLLLFSIIRIESLKGLGYTSAEDIENYGHLLINTQMIGLLLGGLIFGILGDKKGRLSVLFGSIITYSLANIANGFVQNIEQYVVLRFIAGIGLAGELGAGITLVNEIMSKEKRGYGVTVVASVGLLGAVVASLISQKFGWRPAYWIGGGMGIALLLLRVSVAESGLFSQAKQEGVARGNFMMILRNAKRLKIYLYSIICTVPVWYVIGLLVTFCKEFGEALRMSEIPKPGIAILFAYAGLSIGDMLSGLLSQWTRSRKKVQYLFLALGATMSVVYLFGGTWTLEVFYGLCFVLGVFSGYWVISITSVSEHFGTNLRATVTTTVPNFVRGSFVLIDISYNLLKNPLGKINSAAVVGAVVFALAIFAVTRLEETFGKDLNFQEK
jgi:predicted MFS family arabinose efflux permease